MGSHPLLRFFPSKMQFSMLNAYGLSVGHCNQKSCIKCGYMLKPWNVVEMVVVFIIIVVSSST